MTTQTKTANGTSNGNRPSHTVYYVTDQGEDRKSWAPVGAAWPHKDGKGFNIRLDAIPVGFNGNLTVREPKQEKEGR